LVGHDACKSTIPQDEILRVGWYRLQVFGYGGIFWMRMDTGIWYLNHLLVSG
jgi:hypothetical protein